MSASIMKHVVAKFRADSLASPAAKSLNECIAKAVRAYEDTSATTTNDEEDDSDEEEDDSPDSQDLSSHFDPNSRTVHLTSQEKQTMAYKLASEVAGFFVAKQFGECFYMVHHTMTEELLHYLSPQIRLNFRLNFQLGNFYLWPLNFNLMFISTLKFWSIDSLLQPATLAIVTEHLLAFTFDFTSLDGVRKRLSDASRLVEHYFLLEPEKINGFNGQLNEQWFSLIGRQAKAREALEADAPHFRRLLSGPTRPNKSLLIELINPGLVVKMLTFVIIRTAEKIGKHWRALLYYNCLPSYCEYYNYAFPRALAHLEYRLFNGQLLYGIAEQLQAQKGVFLGHIRDANLPGEYADLAVKSFHYDEYDQVAKGLVDQCEQLLEPQKADMEALEAMIQAEDNEEVRSLLVEQLLKCKTQYLRVHRDLYLNRALFTFGEIESDSSLNRVSRLGVFQILPGTTDAIRDKIEESFTFLKEAFAVSPSPGPFSVTLEPLNGSLLLHIANSAIALGYFAEASVILEHLLTTNQGATVYHHRLGDCYLARFLEQSRDSQRIASEVAYLTEGGELKLIKDTGKAELEKAIECYRETRRQVRQLMESRAFEGEEGQAVAQYLEYQKLAYGSDKTPKDIEQTTHRVELTAGTSHDRGIKGKKGKNGVGAKTKETPLPEIVIDDKKRKIDENYSAMHQTFLEEMYIQTTLNLAYCYLWQCRFQDALAELVPLLTNRGLSICSPFAVSQSAYLLACLYAGEAYYELGAGQRAAQSFTYQDAIERFKASHSQGSKDPHGLWRAYLSRATELPYCLDSPTIEEKQTGNILRDIFSYNYLTVLASMGRPERLPGRIARLRPNPIASKGTLCLYANYGKIHDIRLSQLRDSLREGYLNPPGKAEGWKGQVKAIKKEGHTLPECIPGGGGGLQKKKKAGNTQPLTSEQRDLLLVAVYGDHEWTVPENTENPPVPSKTEALNLKLKPDNGFLQIPKLTHKEQLQQALQIQAEAKAYYSECKFTECFRLLDGEMTAELLQALPSNAQLEMIMFHNLSYYATNSETINLMLSYLANQIGNHWNIVNLLDPETLTTVIAYIYAFAIVLTQQSKGKEFACQGVELIEALLWMNVNRCRPYTDVHLVEDETDSEQTLARKIDCLPDTAFRKGMTPLESDISQSELILEKLHPAVASKLLIFLLVNLKDDRSVRLYGKLCLYLRYVKLQIPQGLLLVQYRLFTRNTYTSVSWLLEAQKMSLPRKLEQYPEMAKEFTLKANMAFSHFSTFKEMEAFLLELERHLLGRKEELAKFQAMVEKEKDVGLKSLLEDRLVEARVKYFSLYREIPLTRALIRLDQHENEPLIGDVQRAFEAFNEALSVSSGLLALEPIDASICLHFANNAMALSRYQTAIDILEKLLPGNESNPAVCHRLGDSYLGQYLDLIQDDARIAGEIAKCTGEQFQEAQYEPASKLPKNELEESCRYYLKARHLVGALLESGAIERETQEAIRQLTEYNESPAVSKSTAEVGGPSTSGQTSKKKIKDEVINNKKTKTNKTSKGKKGKFSKGSNKAENSEEKEIREKVDIEIEPEMSQNGNFEQILTEDYLTAQRTFLAKMYIQLSLNLIYCCLLQRRYEDALKEVDNLLNATPSSFSQKGAISLSNYYLAHLYKGVATFELGTICPSYFDLTILWEKFACEKTLLNSAEKRNFEKNYLQVDNELEGLFEDVFSYNYLTVLANAGRGERLPGQLAIIRPNYLTRKNTLPLFARHRKAIPHRLEEVRESLTSGRFNQFTASQKSETRQLPSCMTGASFTAEQLNLLRLVGSSGQLIIPPDTSRSLGVLVEETALMGSSKRKQKIDIKREIVTSDSENVKTLEKSKNQEKIQVNLFDTALGELSDEDDAKDETMINKELQLENRFAYLLANEAQISKKKETSLKSSTPSPTSENGQSNSSFEFVDSEETDQHLAVLSLEATVEKKQEMAADKEVDSFFTDSPVEASHNWESVLRECPHEDWTLPEKSKWAQMDEQMEMGADDEDSEGSDKWDSTCQDTLENDNFLRLCPNQVPAPAESLNFPITSPFAAVSPVVKASSTAVSQSSQASSQAAVNEIGNLLNKFKVADGTDANPASQEETIVHKQVQSQVAPLPQAVPAVAVPVALDLADLSGYLNEEADGTSRRASTQPPGGFSFGPIGHSTGENFDDDEDDNATSDAYMKLSHHYRLMAHFEKKRKAHEKKAKELLQQIEQKKERRIQTKQTLLFELPIGQQKATLSDGTTDWRQSSPHLSQGLGGPIAANGNSSPFSSRTLGLSTSMLGMDNLDELSMLRGFQLPVNSSTNYQTPPTASNSFGLSIDLTNDYFAASHALPHQSFGPTLSMPPDVASQAQLRPPPGFLKSPP